MKYIDTVSPREYYKIGKCPNCYVLTSYVKETIGTKEYDVYVVWFSGSRQECIEMYEKNFERPYTELK